MSPRRHSGGDRFDERQAETYFQALAWQKLDRSIEAGEAFDALLKAAPPGAAAASGETQHTDARTALSHYLAGLGHLGLGETQSAKAEFERALKAAPDCLEAKIELARLQ